MTDEQGAKRAKYVAKVRKAYREGELTDAQADALRAAGVDIERFQPLMPGINDLATTHPELSAQWHPDKNGDLKPTDVVAGSNRKVWWRHRMPDGTWHEWEAKISGRARRGARCPYCSRQIVLPGFNDLATTNPELAKQWHPDKNGDLEPTDLMAGSERKVWWRHWCDEARSWHEWEAVVSNRTFNGTGCPVCAGRQVQVGFNDLATTHPELSAQWHPDKNGDLKPTDITAGSNRKVWWRCDKGHEWQATASKRAAVKGVPCPYCGNKRLLRGFNDVASVRPILVEQWHPTKNGDLKPAGVIASSHQKVWWRHRAADGTWHEWEAGVASRARLGTNCPYCANRKVLLGFNDLATTHPDLAEQWHPDKNGELTPKDVTAGSNRKVWWRHWRDDLQLWHEWRAPVKRRADGSGCPICYRGRGRGVKC